jgi:RNA polymerase sigma factor (sigma-70 family)
MQSVEEASSPSETLILVERYRLGDEDAAQLLFIRYVQRLLDLADANLPPGLARRFGSEDVVQSVFFSLFRAVKEDRVKLEQSGDLWAWLLQVTLNKLRGREAYHLAKKRSVKREEELSSVDDSGDHPFVDRWSKRPSVEELEAIADELDYLFGPCGSPLRRVVDLRLQGFTMEEIGDRLAVSHTTVSRHLKKIGQRFEERLRTQSENGSSVGVTSQ